MKLLNPPKKSIIYENRKIYICLALYPLIKGHTIVVWKKPVKDVHLLTCKEYEYLMDVVDATRDALLRTFKVDKVYLMYMDEVKHVHWHLIPRFNIKGFNLLAHKPKKTRDFSLVKRIKDSFEVVVKNHREL